MGILAYNKPTRAALRQGGTVQLTAQRQGGLKSSLLLRLMPEPQFPQHVLQKLFLLLRQVCPQGPLLLRRPAAEVAVLGIDRQVGLLLGQDVVVKGI